MQAFWWWPFGRVPEIDAQALQAQLKKRTAPQLIDVRTAVEWRRSRIDGAISVPVTEFQARLDAIALDRNRPVVAICLTGHRSIPAVRLLRARGFDACQLREGMRSWWGAGLPVVRD